MCIYSIWWNVKRRWRSQSTVHRNHDELLILLNTVYIAYGLIACMQPVFFTMIRCSSNAIETQKRTKIDWRLQFVLFCIVCVFFFLLLLLLLRCLAIVDCSVLLTIILLRFFFFFSFYFDSHLINENPLISFFSISSVCVYYK